MNPDITLRGGATITGDNSKALIVVDGIVRNSMSDINPSDIESIQVLKDAASTAIYGRVPMAVLFWLRLKVVKKVKHLLTINSKWV